MFWAALILGLGGSLHCLGMCGPIVMALKFGNGNRGTVAALLYNSGRIATYSMLGLLFGLTGLGIRFAIMQNVLSLTAGAVLIAMAIGAFAGWRWKKGHRWIGRLVHKPLSALMRERSLIGTFFIGVLNGLLPCGLVYMAVIPALALAEPAAGAAFMFVFGLGTLPMLFAVAILKEQMPQSFRIKFSRITPVFTLVLGVLFSLRGMELGIPYLSPQTVKIQEEVKQVVDGDEPVELKVCH